MSEGRVLAVGVCAWVGALAPSSLTVWACVLAVTVAVASRQVLLVALTIGLVVSARAGAVADGYEPMPRSRFDGGVELVTDPEMRGFGVRAEVKSVESGQRMVLSASGPPAFRLERAQAGDRIEVRGRATPIDVTDWVRSRHLVGRLAVSEVVAVDSSSTVWAPANWIRDRIRASGRHLDDADRALFLGLVVGDDREQTPAQTARFRLVGMTHLLAVSGQNVAFVLAIVGPLLLRLPIGLRWPAVVVVLTVFAMATRLEPSVLRATVTAGLGWLAVVRGERASGARGLGLAVTVLLFVDPFLVWSIGFRLSVAASLGIVVIGPTLASRLRGPAAWRQAVAVTVAAQLGVAPLLVSTFGPISPMSLPANVLAGWAAGAVMTFGMSVGLVAGALPELVAGVVMWPVEVLLWWLDGVAAVCARAPVAPLGALGLVIGTFVFGAWWLLRSLPPVRHLAAAAAIVVLLIVGGADAAPRPLRGGTWFPATTDTVSVLIVEPGADGRLVEDLVAARISAIDVVVVEAGTRRMNGVVGDLRAAADVGVILAPTDHRIVGARRLLTYLEIEVGDGRTLHVTSGRERLVVTIETPAASNP